MTVFLLIPSMIHAKENAKSGKELNIGDSFFFGCYEQDYDLKNDQLLSNTEPIEWIVIDKTEDRALLLSKYALLGCSIYEEKKDYTWESSELRTYLLDSPISEYSDLFVWYETI